MEWGTRLFRQNSADVQSSTPAIAPVSPALTEGIRQARQVLDEIILDKEQTIVLALSCFLAGGHLLLEDLPGMGKTTLAESMARSLGLQFSRIQFTNDLLPADILGMSVYNQETREFDHREGPVFTQVLLADELNRASPRTQSALLEAMEELQVTQDGHTRRLPRPFFVIATQNPVQQSGVYPLPESQLDRFLMRLSLGYPSRLAERELLLGQYRRAMIAAIQPVLNDTAIQGAFALIHQIYMADPVIDYIQRLAAHTRNGQYGHGLSTRALLGLKRAGQAYAFIQGRTFAIPEDIQAVFPAVTDHRLGQSSLQPSLAQTILTEVQVIPD